MAETFGALGRFQLYSITMVDLDDKRRGDLRTITLFMPNHSETVYERDDEEEIPVVEGKPLSLIGPSRPCYPYDQLRIVFGDLKTSKWEYRTNYDKKLEEDRTHQTITEYVKDKDSDSGALICFALLEEAIDAKLDFTYKDKDKGRVIRITEGEIYATTAGDDVTKLVLRSFGPTETSTHKKKSRYHPKGGEEEEFYPGEPMLLDRSILGLPLGEDLHVTVNVKYSLVPLKIPDAGIVHGHIFETHTVPGTDSPNISNWDFSNAVAPGAKLRLKVTWSDNLRAEREALRLHMLAIAESFSGKLSEGIAVTGEKRRRLEGDSNKYQQE